MAEYTSFLIQLWTDARDGSKRWEVRHAQTNRMVEVSDDSFMLTLWAEPGGASLRGSLKHIASGEMIQFQSSERLLDFLAAHLVLPGGDPGDGDDPIRQLLELIRPQS
ncbi:MAG: hypothetical protein HY316_07935 [Acidobacteria bacterium]|nr:hypothetical protein [Acidobacteriota bacterium]